MRVNKDVGFVLRVESRGSFSRLVTRVKYISFSTKLIVKLREGRGGRSFGSACLVGCALGILEEEKMYKNK